MYHPFRSGHIRRVSPAVILTLKGGAGAGLNGSPRFSPYQVRLTGRYIGTVKSLKG